MSVGLPRTFLLVQAVVLLLCSCPAFAGRSVSLYFDGAVINRDETAKNGYLELSLPASVRVETLRITPVGAARIERVEVIPKQPAKKVEKELATITEREDLLRDRLKALATREEIFTSAAKSQSAKAPRRTKANPEPLAAIRQGTDYAISQLEAVFQLQRKTNRELKQLEEKRARLVKDGEAGSFLARVWLTPAAGTVVASYIQSDRNWQPRYEVRATGGGTAGFAVFPAAVELGRGESGKVVLAPLDKGRDAPSWQYGSASRSLMTTELPVVRKMEDAGPVSLLQLSLTNTTTMSFPAGEFSCYDKGGYQGRGQFPPLEPGRTVELRCSNN